MAEQSEGKRGPGGRPGAQSQGSRAERRASHRVRDDQKSGQGSESALSKLKMIERQRAQVRISRDDD
ncbi:MAG TPA: hypothetical protein VIE63_09405 [Ramlibacter sp.]